MTDLRSAGGVPEQFDPRSDLGVRDFSLAGPLEARSKALAARAALPCANCPGTPAQVRGCSGCGALGASRLLHRLDGHAPLSG